MVCPGVSDAGDGFQIWSIATNIFSKQSRTTDKGRSSCIGLSVRLRTLHCKTFTVFAIKQISDKSYLATKHLKGGVELFLNVTYVYIFQRVYSYRSL
jgi:hypothetical protein